MLADLITLMWFVTRDMLRQWLCSHICAEA